ncbi:hypothetical protein HanPI659440_Chr12g0456551 [Helianthus annuus]|nr:hypothetical protein HanPI659440_Chr12g0456551 [Helianthus annuus]
MVSSHFPPPHTRYVYFGLSLNFIDNCEGNGFVICFCWNHVYKNCMRHVLQTFLFKKCALFIIIVHYILI